MNKFMVGDYIIWAGNPPGGVYEVVEAPPRSSEWSDLMIIKAISYKDGGGLASPCNYRPATREEIARAVAERITGG